MQFLDDTAAVVSPRRPTTRVVSLVPSLTETVALSADGLLVAATDWCTQPADLDVVRIGGTKNPDTARILEIDPDLVIANDEENRGPDIDELRAHGVPVWVTAPRTVAGALLSLRRLLEALDIGTPSWWEQAAQVWTDRHVETRTTALVPIWRRPWMALGRDTFAGDVLHRLGVRNVLADHPERYPRIDLAALPRFDLVVLPDEPYAFSVDDGPEAFPESVCACVSGRHLTWYGPSLVEAHDVLTAQLAAALPAWR